MKNLRSHDGGRTFDVIMGALEELGYNVTPKLLNASAWVPQRRERIFLVGFRDDVNVDMESLQRPLVAPTLSDILHQADETPEEPYTMTVRGRTLEVAAA